MASIQVALFHSGVLVPYIGAAVLVNPSAEEDLQSQMNIFLSTLKPADVRDVETMAVQSGKYGPTTWYYGRITYLQH